jgi:hypothetical protein
MYAHYMGQLQPQSLSKLGDAARLSTHRPVLAGTKAVTGALTN